MAKGRPSSRDRILEAARAIALNVGPAHLSLDAVAERAGLSKGGLLYHFPTKAQLLEALVLTHVAEVDCAIRRFEAEQPGRRNALAQALIGLFREECLTKPPPDSGLLAAIAENPGFIEPVRLHKRDIVDRLRQGSEEPERALVAFLAIEGMHSLKLFDCDALTEAERQSVMDWLLSILDHPGPDLLAETRQAADALAPGDGR